MARNIHFIWLRHEGLPAHLAQCVQSWKEHHPSWMVRVWGPQDIEGMRLKPWIDRCESRNSKTELMSYEIVHRHGGVFSAIDIHCLKRLDELFDGEHGHTLLLCDDQKDRNFCTNTWFAATRPGNPVLEKLLTHIERDETLHLQLEDRANHYDKYDFVGPKLFGRVYSLCCDNATDGKVIVLPRSCFYPYGWFDNDPRDRQGPFVNSYGHCLWTEWWKA